MGKIKCHICSYKEKSGAGSGSCASCGTDLTNTQAETIQKFTMGQYIKAKNAFFSSNTNGFLYLTNQRLIFLLASLAKGSKLVFSIPINQIQSVELPKFSVSQLGKLIIVHTDDGASFSLEIPKREEWKTAIESVIS